MSKNGELVVAVLAGVFASDVPLAACTCEALTAAEVRARAGRKAIIARGGMAAPAGVGLKTTDKECKEKNGKVVASDDVRKE